MKADWSGQAKRKKQMQNPNIRVFLGCPRDKKEERGLERSEQSGKVIGCQIIGVQHIQWSTGLYHVVGVTLSKMGSH